MLISGSLSEKPLSVLSKIISTLDSVVNELKTDKQNYESKLTEILKPLQDLLKKQFEDKGKTFVVPDGTGIVPQDIYDSEFRSPDDPDYKPKEQ